MHQRNSSVVEELEFHLAAKERVVPAYLVHSQNIRHFFKIILKAFCSYFYCWWLDAWITESQDLHFTVRNVLLSFGMSSGNHKSFKLPVHAMLLMWIFNFHLNMFLGHFYFNIFNWTFYVPNWFLIHSVLCCFFSLNMLLLDIFWNLNVYLYKYILL